MTIPIGGHVAGAVALQHQSLDGGFHEVGYGLCPDGREHPEEDDVPVETGVGVKLGNLLGTVDGLVVHLEIDAGLDQRRHVGALEGVQRGGAHLFFLSIGNIFVQSSWHFT